MAERYSKLFSLPENLYAQGSPVVIAAGALLKDNVAGNVLAQLKIQSISDKPIKAVKVAITPLDSVGRLLGGEVEYQYLDLDVKRDDFFGVKTPVALPDSTTRSYTVRVVEVAFGDNSLWNEAGAPCETLPKQRTLASALGDAGIAEQYKKDVGNNWSDREPAEHKDLWLCACGAINKRSEPCHKCLKTFVELTNFDVEKLKENREAWRKNDIYSEAETLMKQGSYEQSINEFARIRGWCDSDAMITACENKIKEREEKAKADALAAKLRVKKQKRRAITITIIVLIIIALALATYYVGIPYIKYRQALVMIEHGEYTEAYTQLEELNGFYDSEEQIKAGKYKQAVEMIGDGNYNRAYNILEQLGDYGDAQNVIKQSKYDRGIAHIETGEYDKGYALLNEVIIYKDAEQQIYDSKYSRGVAHIEAEQYENGYDLLDEIGATDVINESKYNRGIEYFENGDYNSGYELLMSIKSYKDAESKAKELLYQQGLKFYNDKDYETSNFIFKKLGNYKDSKDLIHSHEYTSKIKAKATCENTGVKTHTCDCGHSYTETIKATGHDYSSKVTKKATCEENGVRTYTCDDCNKSYTETIKATGHDGGTKATCTKASYCTECGEKVGKALGHTTSTGICSRCKYNFWGPVEMSGTLASEYILDSDSYYYGPYELDEFKEVPKGYYLVSVKAKISRGSWGRPEFSLTIDDYASYDSEVLDVEYGTSTDFEKIIYVDGGELHVFVDIYQGELEYEITIEPVND